MAIKTALRNVMMICMGTFSCRRVAALSYDYSEGLLSPRQQKKYQKHLKRCRACLRLINSYKAIRKLGSSTIKERLDPEQKEKILEGIL